MARMLAVAVADAPRVSLSGQFERHVDPAWRELTGSNSGGRWGPTGAYCVLYLGRPRASVVVEAYRHLVDPFAADGMTGEFVGPRVVLTCEVSVTEILDLREEDAQRGVGLTAGDLTSAVGDYDACHRVARIAHQLTLHGIIAPAATGLGDTLALFEQHLPASELPTLTERTTWERLPADPRRLRIVRDADGSS